MIENRRSMIDLILYKTVYNYRATSRDAATP
jgi:hypothetical protein